MWKTFFFKCCFNTILGGVAADNAFILWDTLLIQLQSPGISWNVDTYSKGSTMIVIVEIIVCIWCCCCLRADTKNIKEDIQSETINTLSDKLSSQNNRMDQREFYMTQPNPRQAGYFATAFDWVVRKWNVNIIGWNVQSYTQI
jgi:hypothetical protein